MLKKESTDRKSSAVLFNLELRRSNRKTIYVISYIFIFLLVTHRSLTPRFFSTRLDGYSSQHGESFQSHNKQNINNVFRPIFNITSLETHSESNKTKKVTALEKTSQMIKPMKKIGGENVSQVAISTAKPCLVFFFAFSLSCSSPSL